MSKQQNENKSKNRELAKKIGNYKKICEANVVGCFYKNPELYRLYDNELVLEDFSINTWKVYYSIGKGIIIDEQKETLDEITLGLYLEKHPKLAKKYEEYDGYNTILEVKEYIDLKNIDGYLAELDKWNKVVELMKMNWFNEDDLSDIVDMSTEEIYDYYEVVINNIFLNSHKGFKSYDILDSMEELIEELNDGHGIGLPYSNLDILSSETSGQLLGNITLVGGTSGVGKSAFVRNSVIPSVIENKERIVIILNEEGIKRWQKELLIYIANNELGLDLQKHSLKNGNFNNEIKSILNESLKILKEKIENKLITIIPLDFYTTSKAIKILKKYSSLGVKYFVLDTFKPDKDLKGESYIAMQQSMVDINDVIKPESKNLHILVTFQLNKSSTKQRYYTQDNIGMAKNIVDVASTCIMVRNMFDDEYPNGKKELKVYKLIGDNGKSKQTIEILPNKHYQIIFIIKNREGVSNKYQIVIEHDLSRNIMKEVGICNVPIDF